MTVKYDLVVLGGGPGGYVAALRASQLGMKVAIVEKNKVGGTCLHDGCIPTKTLLKSAELFRDLKRGEQFGISGIDLDALSINYEQIYDRKEKTITQLYQGVQHLLNSGHIDVYDGHGRILGPSIFSPLSGTISVEHSDGRENTLLSPQYVLIATGSQHKQLKGLQVDGSFILDSEQMLRLKSLPESVMIIGGGVIGIEFASMLHDFGVDVTVIEANESILLTEDKDIRVEAERLLKKRGIQLHTDCTVDVSSLNIDDRVSINMENSQETIALQAEKMLVAAGRQANIEEIGIENTNIRVNNGFIETNDMFQTEESHIYAIGDCIGGMELAHVASKEGKIAVEHMANKEPISLNELMIPSCIYSYPEISRIGLTEQQAKEAGFNLKIGKFPFSHIGKSVINGEQDGFIKIISDKNTDDLLGIHMIGSQVTELISEASLAKVLDATPWEISHTVHPHPSMSEAFMEAALNVNDEQIHG